MTQQSPSRRLSSIHSSSSNLVIQQELIQDILGAKLCAGHWEFIGEQGRGKLCLLGSASLFQQELTE